MSDTSYFTQGMDQGVRDVGRTLGFTVAITVATAMSTSFPTTPLSIRERRDFLRGYAAGLLQGLSESRSRDVPVPAVKEGAGD